MVASLSHGSNFLSLLVSRRKASSMGSSALPASVTKFCEYYLFISCFLFFNLIATQVFYMYIKKIGKFECMYTCIWQLIVLPVKNY